LSRVAAGWRYAVWTTLFASRRTSITWPMSRPFGYGERTPPASSSPAVVTSSPSSIVSVESMFVINRAPSS